MASTDLTGILARMKGTNSDTNYKQLDAYVVNAAENAGILTVETHDLVKVPAGKAVVGITAVLLSDATSEGSATLQFKAKVGSGTAEAVNGTAYAVAAMKSGKVYRLPFQAVSGYAEADATVIQITVAGAAFTALKFMLLVETIPLDSFLSRG